MTKATKDVLPNHFTDFRNIHKDETIIVCGCGESLNELEDPGRFITIGVNDVGRLFDPAYLVVLNPRHQFKGDRFSFVESSRARAVFSQLKLGIDHPKIISIKLGKRGGTDIHANNALPYTKNSPYVAICLAMYMGARRIGIIGVDFTDNHFFNKSGQHALAKHLKQINAEYAALNRAARDSGIDIVNLSSQSRITAFEKQSLETFYAQSLPAQIQDTVSDSRSLRLFLVNYKFLACGDVFTDGLVHAADAMDLQYQAAHWDDPQLPGKINRFAPDIVFVVHGRRFVQKWRDRIRHPNMAVWLLDEPYEVDDTAKFSRYFRTVFVNDPNTLERHNNAHYLPVAFDPQLHRPADVEKVYKTGFIGGYNKTREAFLLELLEAGHLDYVVGGPWRDRRLKAVCLSTNVSPAETTALYQKTQIVINVFRDTHHFNRAGTGATSLNPRVYEALACGAAVVSEYRPELDSLFPEIPVFTTPQELVSIVGELLSEPERLHALVHACRSHLEHHGYACRLQQVLQKCLPDRFMRSEISNEKLERPAKTSGYRHPEYAILMVVHNASDIVKISVLKTLRHIAGQPARLFIVDNASSDGIESWLAMLEARGDIELIRNEQNIGHGPGLELARARSRSRYLVALDSDAFPLCDDWLHQMTAELSREIKMVGIGHHRDYIHPSCLLIRRQTMDDWKLSFLDEKSRPSRFDVAERMSHEIRRRGYRTKALQRNGEQRRGSVSEPVYLGSRYEDLVYHQWYSTRVSMEGEGRVDDVPEGAISECLQALYENSLGEPRDITVIIGMQARKDEPQRIRNAVAVARAINLQDLERWRYRVIFVEQDREPQLDQIISPLVDHYKFVYNPGAYNRSWGFNVGACLTNTSAGYLCLLDADILVPEDFLSSCLQLLESGHRALRPFSSIKYLDEASSQRAINQRLKMAVDDTHDFEFEGQVYRNSEGGCIFVETPLYHEIGGHDERFRGWGFEDREFSRRLSRHTRLFQSETELIHLYHPESGFDSNATRINRALWRKNCKGHWKQHAQTPGNPHLYENERTGPADKPDVILQPGRRDWELWHGWNEQRIEQTVKDPTPPGRTASLREQFADHVIGLGSHILDVGCGAGTLWPYFQRYVPGASWIGLDVTQKMLGVAHRLFPEVNLIHGDAGHLPFEDRSVDVVVLRHLLEHMPSWLVEQSLVEGLRVARHAVVVGFYLPPSKQHRTRTRRIAEGFIENRWAESDLFTFIKSASARIAQQRMLRMSPGQQEMVWTLEPAHAIQFQDAEHYQDGFKVSIIMPTYRREHTIQKTIASIRNQTYSNWELIIIDNQGHGDYYFDDRRIQLYRHAEVTSASYARNQGLQYISGDLVCFFDDDDDMYPEYLESFVKAFESHPQAKMVRCGMLVSNGRINYSYATPECCLRREYVTPTWLNDGQCQDQNYFQRIINIRGWSIDQGDIIILEKVLCKANSDRKGGLRAGRL